MKMAIASAGSILMSDGIADASGSEKSITSERGMLGMGSSRNERISYLFESITM